MPWKEPHERQTDALVEAIQHAAHRISNALTEGFNHMANAEATALADLQAAVVDIGTAIAAEITALQNAINAQGVNNSPAIEASVSKMRDMIGALKASTAPPVVTPVVPAVASISPTSGPVAGGTSVTLTGTGLTGASGVTVGGLAATALQVASDTSLSFTTPASVAGPGNVVVTGPAGASVDKVAFTYA
jgi:hypothetical protein